MENPPAVIDPLAGTESSCQYGAAAPVGWRSSNSPVTRKDTGAPVLLSRSLSTSPGVTPSNAAAGSGSAAGIGPRAPGAEGQSPDTSTA